MIPLSLQKAIEDSWSIETCHPDSVPNWSQSKPSVGQCGVTALLLQEIFGGTIVCNFSLHHVWNRFSNDTFVDLTRSQFSTDIISVDGKISRENMFFNKLALKAQVKKRYELFRSTVLKKLGVDKFDKYDV